MEPYVLEAFRLPPETSVDGADAPASNAASSLVRPKAIGLPETAPFFTLPCRRTPRGAHLLSYASVCCSFANRGAASKRLNLPRWNGSTGSTIDGFSSPSATFRQPKPKSSITPYWTNQTWPHNLNQTASDKPGAVQTLRGKRLLWFIMVAYKRKHLVG